MTPQQKARATRAANKGRRFQFEAEQARVKRDQAKIEATATALQRLADDPGATPAERENALQKLDSVIRKRKAAPNRAFLHLPETAEEFAALLKKPAPRRRKAPSPEPPKAPARLAIAHADSADGSKDAEIAHLKRKIEHLKKEIARLKQAAEPGKPGRKPTGERAMTAAERMRKMRLRNTAQ